MVFRYRMMILSQELQSELRRGADALQIALAREENEAAWALLQETPDLSENVRSAAQRYAATVARVRQALRLLEELSRELEEVQDASDLQNIDDKARTA